MRSVRQTRSAALSTRAPSQTLTRKVLLMTIHSPRGRLSWTTGAALFVVSAALLVQPAVAGPPAGADGLDLPLCIYLPELPTARCGQITVPLDRSDPVAGSTTVAFAVVPRTDTRHPSLGTIVPNPGGPGSSTIDLAGGSFAEALQPLLKRRELLLMDPRGVGRSSPLTCAALDDAAKAPEGLAEQRRRIGECGRQLGTRVGYYGTAAVADDLDDVRTSLGLRRLDLLGISYGTYLMPTYAQRHPRHVRTITLAGAYAVNIPTVGTLDVAAFRRSVRLVCERTTECSGGTVLADLEALAADLRQEPTTVGVDIGGHVRSVVLDEWQLTTTAAALFTSRPDTKAQLAMADAAASSRRGDLEPLRNLVRARITKSSADETLGTQLVSQALLWATTCHDYPREFNLSDDLPTRAIDFHAYVAASTPPKFYPFTPEAWLTRADYDTGACLEWPDDPTATAPFPPGAKMPNVPVLVLSGDLDANTSSGSARQAAAQFRRATFVEVAGAGHTPASTAEGVNLIVRFIDRRRL